MLSILLSLTGCTGAYDGTYLIFYALSENSVDPEDPAIGVEDRGTVAIYHTKEGSFAIDGLGALLAGTREGKEFTASYENGMDYAPAYDDCDTSLYKTTLTMTGTFTEGGVFEAKLTEEDQSLVKSCGADVDEIETYAWTLQGMRVDVDSNQHLGDDANWGSTPYANWPSGDTGWDTGWDSGWW